jgi:acyl-CoA thioester hydrolase
MASREGRGTALAITTSFARLRATDAGALRPALGEALFVSSTPDVEPIVPWAMVADMAQRDELPRPAFSHRIIVTSRDIDPLGHANNVVYLQWVQDVAVAHSRSVGLDWDAYQKLGAIFVVRKHEIEYLSPALLGETLEIATWVSSTRGASSVRETLVARPDGAPTARACTTWVLCDLGSGRPRRVPPDVSRRFEAGSLPPDHGHGTPSP